MTVYYDLPKPVVKHECPSCGRESGHHLNCPDTGKIVVLDDGETVTCAADGCQDAPKPWGGKGAKPKYCAAHGK